MLNHPSDLLAEIVESHFLNIGCQFQFHFLPIGSWAGTLQAVLILH